MWPNRVPRPAFSESWCVVAVLLLCCVADVLLLCSPMGCRADHLLEDVMEKRMVDTKITAEERTEAKLIHAKADAYTPEELQELFAKFEISSCGNSTKPFFFPRGGPSRNATPHAPGFALLVPMLIGC